jgi:iron complex transport system substrate-binding protein
VVFLLLISGQLCAQIRVHDDLHRAISLAAPAQRIVSLAPSITETLFALGAGDQIAGVTDYCTYPAEARTKPRVGGVINPSIEAIVGLRPDLVVMSMEGNTRQDFEKLVELGVPVFVSNPRSLEGIFHSIKQLGVLTGRADTARRLVEHLRTRAAQIAARAARLSKPSVLLFVSLQPMIVVGRGTFMAELIERAGGRNCAAHSASSFPAYSREAVLKDDPDVLIFLSDVLPDSAALVRLYPEWSGLRAVRANALLRVEADIVSRPGPRVVDALEMLFRFLHPTAQSQPGKP